jgi:flagellar biosynthesis protein FlhB
VSDDGGQEKTQEPTAKREEDFREEGKVPRSKDLVSSLALAIGGLMMIQLTPGVGRHMIYIFQTFYAIIPIGTLDRAGAEALAAYVLVEMAVLLAPVFGMLFMVTLIIGLVQGQGIIPKDPIKLDWGRLDPLKQAKELYLSPHPIVELVKSVLKVGLIGWLVWTALRDRPGWFLSFQNRTAAGMLYGYKELAIIVLSRALPVALILSVMDYVYQWYRLQEQKMMTKEEVKEEHKASDGDPNVKAARKRRMMQISQSKAIQNVKNADVVITNPTHYAVAIRYRKEEAPAPLVLARGVDAFAQRIKAEAMRHDVPQVENRALARTLYKQSREGKMIPEDLFAAVARVLAVLWKRRAARPGLSREIRRAPSSPVAGPRVSGR